MAGGKQDRFNGVRPNRLASSVDEFELGMFKNYYKAASVIAGKTNSLLYTFAIEEEAWTFALELGVNEQSGDGRLPMPFSIQDQLAARKQGRFISERDAAEQTAVAEVQKASNAPAAGGVSAVARSEPSAQLVPGSSTKKQDMEIDTAGVHAQKQRKLAPFAEAVIGEQAGILGTGPSAGTDPGLNAMHMLASQITNLSGVVSTLGGRLSAIESGLVAAAPASVPTVVAPIFAPTPVGPQPPSLSPSPSLLNYAAAPF
jgi:hypothetical protein